MSDSNLVPRAISLQSTVVELEQPSPWLCTTCGDVFEVSASGGRPAPQRCGCQREPDAPRWPGHDFNTHVELCRCCGLVPLQSGNRFAVWFCPGCLVDVLRLNAEAERTVVPLGRHSALHGHELHGGQSAEEAREDAAALLQFMQELSDGIDRLQSFFQARLATLLAVDHREDARRVRLAGFLERLEQSKKDEASRRTAFEDLCRHVGFRAWPQGDITAAPETPDFDDWGTKVDATYMAICPVCGTPHECSHLLITYDRTFPGEPVNGPIEYFEIRAVFEAAWRLLAVLNRAHPEDSDEAPWRSIAKPGSLPPRLRDVLRTVHENHELDEVDPNEPALDGYVVKHHLDDYLEDVFASCPGRFVGATSHEDCIPMASSAYGSLWALDGEACAAAAKEIFAKDIAQLHALRVEVR